MNVQRLAVTIGLALAFTLHTSADEGVKFFEQNIRPVLIQHCYACHSEKAEKLKGNLLLDSRAGWAAGGDSGEAVIVPGDPDASLLLRTVMHLESGMEMPPGGSKLPEAVIADLKTWIEMGAPDPRDGQPVVARRADKTWWSLQPLRTFDTPSKTDAPPSVNAIDDLIDATLAKSSLSRNPPADPRTLIRRMTYDLTGLPPAPAEVDTFIRDYQTDPSGATERLVDRLLASPRYGEHWGRHWLDVVRFGESNGFERNFIINDLWPFRDYVIRSLNEDKPFNQFIIEHLAGDVVGKDDPQVEVGSAFLVAGPYDDVGNQSVEAQANIRAATLDDIITVTGGAFLGLTINCARCHHHKFDPIPTEDYYRVRAALEGVRHGRRVVATADQRQAHDAARQPLEASLKQVTDELNSIQLAIDERAKEAADKLEVSRPKIDPHGTEEVFPPHMAQYVRFVIHGFTSVPASKKPPTSAGGKLTEFQVWSTDGTNVALASHGTRAEGAKSAKADDFPEAYGPQYCIDGATGEAWFIGNPPVLTLAFAKPENIHRVNFINARGERGTDESKVAGATPCEYEVQVSLDGETWTTVATDAGREPWSPAHRLARAKSMVMTDDDSARIETLEKEIGLLRQKLNSVPPLTQMWVGTHSQPQEMTFVHRGGDPMQPGEPVTASSLSVLEHVTEPYELASNADQGQRRLSLAQWITRDDNPLTPRVLANRVWHYHFGTGIVDTPSDFGFLGSLPTHPELLDYLANRLIQSDWRLKPLHREILLSQTYQQSSAYREDAASVDAAARFLWRFPPRRLSAEEIRDTTLVASGQMRLEPMGGPGFRLYQHSENNVSTYFPLDVHGPETYRRGVYHQTVRASVVDVLSDFDLPDTAFATPARANTTTPLQALTLLNHSFIFDMATSFASRLSPETPVEDAYRILFQRPANPEEVSIGSEFIASYGTVAFSRALLNANELLHLD